MKKISIIPVLIFTFLFTTFTDAQNNESISTGFGGPSVQVTQFDGEWTSETGGFGACFLTKNLYLGGGGFGLFIEKGSYKYSMGYGGIMLGYVIAPQNKIHLNSYLLGGWGGITERSADQWEFSDDFFIIKPSVELEFNVTNWMRIAAGGGYKLVLGANIPSVDNSDLSSLYGSISLRFGVFDK